MFPFPWFPTSWAGQRRPLSECQRSTGILEIRPGAMPWTNWPMSLNLLETMDLPLLVSAGILEQGSNGSRTYYRADQASPIFPGLQYIFGEGNAESMLSGAG